MQWHIIKAQSNSLLYYSQPDVFEEARISRTGQHGNERDIIELSRGKAVASKVPVIFKGFTLALSMTVKKRAEMTTHYTPVP